MTPEASPLETSLASLFSLDVLSDPHDVPVGVCLNEAALTASGLSVPSRVALTVDSAVAFAAIANAVTMRRPRPFILRPEGAPGASAFYQGYEHSSATSEPTALRYDLPPEAVNAAHLVGSLYPIACVTLTPTSTSQLARDVSGALRHLAATQAPALSDDITTLALRLALELLKNASEHAYSTAATGPVLIGASLTKTRPLLDSGVLPHPVEAWLQRLGNPGMLLELSLADVGLGIPATLGAAFKTYSARAPEAPPPSTIDVLATQRYHHAICRWALQHHSTSRTQSPIEPATLTWRGLHQVLHACHAMHARLEVRSAAGFLGVSMDGRSFSLDDPDAVLHGVFPGTQATLRIPLDHSTTPWRPPKAPEQRSTRLVLKDILQEADTEAWRALCHTWPDDVHPVGIVHSFETNDHASVSTWATRWRDLPPHLVPIHLCVDMSRAMLDFLAPIDIDDPTELDGPPRLIGLSTSVGAIEWRFLGLIPASCFDAATELLAHGRCTIPNSPQALLFFELLTNAYRGWILRDASICTFASHSLGVADESIRAATQLAFASFLKDRSTPRWFYDDPNLRVRLTTGRLVSRYVSVYQLLEAEACLAAHLSVLLRHHINTLCLNHAAETLMADSPATYWILQRLLGEASPALAKRIVLPDDSIPVRPILIADGIYRGESASRLLRSLNGAQALLVLIDFRATPSPVIEGTPVISLLHLPFDPGEVPNVPSTSANPVTILESDLVTHIPMMPAADSDLTIGTTKHREDFLDANPRVCALALRRSGRGVLPASISIETLLNLARDDYISWVADELALSLQPASTSDVIIIVREGARVRSTILELSAALRHRFPATRAISLKRLPVVHVAGTQLFPRGTHNFFDGLEVLANDPVRYADPPSGVCVLYLEDRCVTGRTLHAVLRGVHDNATRYGVCSLVAVPVESRLPRRDEEFLTTLLSHWRIPEGHGDSSGEPLVRYRPLFRVPVRPIDGTAEMAAVSSLSHLREHARLADRDSGEEIQRALDRLSHDRWGLKPGSPHFVELRQLFPAALPGVDLHSNPSLLRLRALLSLFSENVGALSLLLATVEGLARRGRFETLGIFSREPDLLDTAPIRYECARSVAELCTRAFEDDSGRAWTADALVVLWMQGADLTNKIGTLLSTATKGPVVFNVLLAVLSAAVRSRRLSADELLVSLRRLKGALPIETYRRLSVAITRAGASVDEPPLSEAAARRRILHAFMELAYHGTAWESIKRVNAWAALRPSARARADATQLRSQLEHVSLVVQATVIPALGGLEHLLLIRAQRTDARGVADDVAALRDGLVALRSAIEDFDSSRELGQRSALAVSSAWSSLSIHLPRVSADRFLELTPEGILRSLEVASKATLPPLERVAEEVTCCPYQVWESLGSSLRPQTPLDRMSRIVVFVPRNIVHRVFELIRIDMTKHGTGRLDTLRCSYSAKAKSLRFRFDNGIRRTRHPGNKRSQREVRGWAEEFGFRVRFTPIPRDRYISELEFVDAIDIAEADAL